MQKNEQHWHEACIQTQCDRWWETKSITKSMVVNNQQEHTHTHPSQRQCFHTNTFWTSSERGRNSQAIDIDVCRSQKVISNPVTFLITLRAAFIATESCSEATAKSSRCCRLIWYVQTEQDAMLHWSEPNDCLFFSPSTSPVFFFFFLLILFNAWHSNRMHRNTHSSFISMLCANVPAFNMCAVFLVAFLPLSRAFTYKSKSINKNESLF